MAEKKTISVEELIAQEQERSDISSFSSSTDSTKYNDNSVQDLRRAKKYNKFYLPALHLNDTSMWPPKLKSERRHLTSKVAKETCLLKCCGHPGVFSGCCQMDPDDFDHVIGPIDEKWIKKIIKYFGHKKENIKYTRHDIVIDREEGELIGDIYFSSHEVFKDPGAYPILRLQVNGPRFACKFLNIQTGKCTIYGMRPKLCRDYHCEYIKTNFLVQTQNGSNIYRILR